MLQLNPKNKDDLKDSTLTCIFMAGLGNHTVQLTVSSLAQQNQKCPFTTFGTELLKVLGKDAHTPYARMPNTPSAPHSLGNVKKTSG